jgi:hypothetical protein
MLVTKVHRGESWTVQQIPLDNRHFHNLDDSQEVQAERSCDLRGLPRAVPVSNLFFIGSLTLLKNASHHQKMILEA